MGKSSVREKEVYSALEVANICGVVNQTAINWIKNGYLKAFKTPGGQFRVYLEDLVAFMKSRSMHIPESVLEQMKNEKTLLIVDDDRTFNSVLKKFLDDKGVPFSINQAFDGFEAGINMERLKPECIILDIDLPGIDGIKLLEKLSDDKTLGKPVIFVVTGLEDAELEPRCLSFGASEVFKKPLDFSAMLSCINSRFKL